MTHMNLTEATLTALPTAATLMERATGGFHWDPFQIEVTRQGQTAFTDYVCATVTFGAGPYALTAELEFDVAYRETRNGDVPVQAGEIAGAEAIIELPDGGCLHTRDRNGLGTWGLWIREDADGRHMSKPQRFSEALNAAMTAISKAA